MQIKEKYTEKEIEEMTPEQLAIAITYMVGKKFRNMTKVTEYLGLAWNLIHDLENHDLMFQLSNVIPNSDPIVYEIHISGMLHYPRLPERHVDVYSTGYTPQEAICRAYLLVRSEVNNV